jgi:hypothetical protein
MRHLVLSLLLTLTGCLVVVGCGSTTGSGVEGDRDAADDHETVLPPIDAPVGTLDGGPLRHPTFPPDAQLPTGDAGHTGAADVTVTATVDAGKFTTLPSPPQVVNDDGGVLSSPIIVAIFFNNDDPSLEPTLQEFYKGLGTSSVWKAATEYGVGPATTQIVELNEAAPATIDDTPDQQGDNTALETWLLGEITNKTLPAVTPNTTYMINYPTGTTVTSMGNQCVDFDGYHSDMQDNDNNLISYGVVPRCTDMGSTTEITFTSTVTHEAIEAATDPWPDYSPAWAQADNAHLFFDEANDGSEVADMCENDPEAYYAFSDFPYTVQRIWSNKAALAGHDPCVPELPNTVFFNAVPELPDTGPFDYYGSTVDVSSISIPVGGTKTVYLDLYSDGSVPDWDVTVFDLNVFNGAPANQALLTINQTVTTGNNGDRIPVEITVKSAGDPNTNGEIQNTEIFAIVSSQGLSETAPAHFWYGIVTN